MKKTIYILFLIITLLLNANDNLHRQIDYANQLFDQEKYFDAITEFKRLQFFDEEKIYSFQTNYKIGVAYKKGGYFENAIKYLSKAKFETQKQNEQLQVDFQIIRCNILRGTFERSLQLLDQIDPSADGLEIQNEINYWQGWTYMLWDKWDSAAVHFGNISNEHDLKILCEKVSNNKYSVTFARVISYILPGAGQVYTGNYFSGFMSLGWNFLWGYLSINSFVENRAFDGIAIGSLLWFRFYRGNIQNSEKLATKENIKIANEALLFLMENYEGDKP